jgi:hypothetical protein
MVEVFSTGSGGLHPWAQALYGTDVAATGSRLAVQAYLSAMVRPIDLTLQIYERAGAPPADLAEMRHVLALRRAAWQRRLREFECRDVYPLAAIERYIRERVWFGCELAADDVARHLEAVEDELSTFPNYSIALLEGEELYFNFVLDDGAVHVEGGSEYEPEPAKRIVGGLRINAPEVVEQFRAEFDRVWAAAALKRPSDVCEWLRERRRELLS